MLAEDELREGNLDEALAQLKQAVRQNPDNSEYRVFLFQLLAVLGQWDAALTQLNVAGELDAATLAMVQAYREAINCEVLRAEIFAGKRSPLIFGEPERWLAMVIQALQLTATGQLAEGQQLRGEALEEAPATSGKIDLDGEETQATFQWIADADSRLGPILEAVVNGRYYWVPFHRIRQVDIEKPVDLRDVVWMPAHFTWSNGGETVGLIPTRYCGSETCDDPRIRLARKTEWQAQNEEVYFGLGQRMMATDAGEYPLMDIRQITVNCEEAA